PRLLPAERPAHTGRSRHPRLAALGYRPTHAARPDGSGHDRRSRRPARPGARPRRLGSTPPGRRTRRGPPPAHALRDGGRGPPAAPVPDRAAQLVPAPDLGASAQRLLDGARAAGLLPPTRFGTEAVARLLGLRFDHPAAQESLELLPDQTATRAEAAYSAAKILRYKGWEVAYVQDLVANFSLPRLSGWPRTVAQTAVFLIGYPYVWGGTSELPQAPFGVLVPGGFDCSGF